MSVKTLPQSTDNKTLLFSLLMAMLTRGKNALSALQTLLAKWDSKLGTYVTAAELFGASYLNYEPADYALENRISTQVAQTDRVMQIIMIGVFVIVGIFVVATIYSDIPDTGVTEADNSVDNFTSDLFGHFELFATVVLIIIIVLIVFYVRQMER